MSQTLTRCLLRFPSDFGSFCKAFTYYEVICLFFIKWCSFYVDIDLNNIDFKRWQKSHGPERQYLIKKRKLSQKITIMI